MNDRDMHPEERVFIMDYEGRIAEILGGENRSFKDGCSYTLSDEGRTVNRIGSAGFIEDMYDAHPSREAITRLLALPAR